MEQSQIKTRKDLMTEKQNPNSRRIDQRSIVEILDIISREDQTIAGKVRLALPAIEKAVELAFAALQNGHRIFYIGAGTSGRLGVLDATEMPPTYSVSRDLFQGVIAGGCEALIRSIEGVEDKPMEAVKDLKQVGLSAGDFLLGIASSSATPYVISALEYGKSVGASTIYLICNPEPLTQLEVDVLIAVNVGPEIITGSTRMKSGTATKMVLNMISTTTMIRLGKVYGNLMVDLQVVNDKLLDRGTRIIEKLTNLDYKTSRSVLKQADGSVKTAIVMAIKQCDKSGAQQTILKSDGILRNIIGNIDE